MNVSDRLESLRQTYEYRIHTNVFCDECYTKPIRGLRFKCTVCDSYDLCLDCFLLGRDLALRTHSPEHKMKVIGGSSGNSIWQTIGYARSSEIRVNESGRIVKRRPFESRVAHHHHHHDDDDDDDYELHVIRKPSPSPVVVSARGYCDKCGDCLVCQEMKRCDLCMRRSYLDWLASKKRAEEYSCRGMCHNHTTTPAFRRSTSTITCFYEYD